MHVNMSLNSGTFEKYYFKPRDQYSRGRNIMKSIFETKTKNRTTSDVRLEPTAILLGTTHKSKVLSNSNTKWGSVRRMAKSALSLSINQS